MINVWFGRLVEEVLRHVVEHKNNAKGAEVRICFPLITCMVQERWVLLLVPSPSLHRPMSAGYADHR
jgi:hypothetical protein